MDIVLSTDFSDLARVALPHALGLAKATGHSIRLVHVINYLGPSKDGAPSGWGPEALDAIRQQLLSELGDTANNVETHVVAREGFPATVLIDEMGRDAAYGVVATHGLSGLRSLLPGSVAVKVYQKAPIPVLAVPPGCSETTVDHVLLPIDFSEPDSGALRQGLAIAQAYGARATLLHVVEPVHNVMVSGMGPVQVRTEFNTTVDDAKVQLATLLPEGAQVTCDAIAGARAADAIAEYASENGVNMVIMPAHGRSGWQRLLLGSVTHDVVRQSKCPVMVLHLGQAHVSD